MTEARPDRGSVTLELAVALPVLVLAAALALWALSLAAAQLRAVEGARAGARAAARGDPDVTVVALTARLAEVRRAEVQVARLGGEVTVRVRTAVPVPGVLQRLVPRWRVSAAATAVEEPP